MKINPAKHDCPVAEIGQCVECGGNAVKGMAKLRDREKNMPGRRHAD